MGYAGVEKQHGWPSRLLGIASYIKLKGGVYAKELTPALRFCKKNLLKIML